MRCWGRAVWGKNAIRYRFECCLQLFRLIWLFRWGRGEPSSLTQRVAESWHAGSCNFSFLIKLASVNKNSFLIYRLFILEMMGSCNTEYSDKHCSDTLSSMVRLGVLLNIVPNILSLFACASKVFHRIRIACLVALMTLHTCHTNEMLWQGKRW